MTQCIYCGIILSDGQKMCVVSLFECRARTASKMEFMKADYAIFYRDYKQLQKDVERLTRELDFIADESVKQDEAFEQAAAERDAARAVACRLLESAVHGGEPIEWWVERHPWLKEREGEG